MKHWKKMRTGTLSFFKALFTNPRSIGAIIPSSSYLANSIAKCINQPKISCVLELGPGTGAITSGILKSGVSSDKLTALELSPEFTTQLIEDFPGLNIAQGDATQLSTLMHGKQFDYIISSLPLRSIPKTARNKILNEIPKVLSPNGKFIQFTYAIFSDKKQYPNYYKLEKSFIEWRNIPPARVDVFSIELEK